MLIANVNVHNKKDWITNDRYIQLSQFITRLCLWLSYTTSNLNNGENINIFHMYYLCKQHFLEIDDIHWAWTIQQYKSIKINDLCSFAMNVMICTNCANPSIVVLMLTSVKNDQGKNYWRQCFHAAHKNYWSFPNSS